MSSTVPDPREPSESRDVEALPASDEVLAYRWKVERAAKALLVLYFGRRGRGYEELLGTIAHEHGVEPEQILDADVMGIAKKSFGYQFGGSE